MDIPYSNKSLINWYITDKRGNEIEKKSYFNWNNADFIICCI